MTPYDIPADNPFAGQNKCGPGFNTNDCPEIYAWGLRNCWRWSFDADTGELWLGDVGHGTWEEVDLIELGGNYGWRCREGAHDHNTAGCGTGLIDPITEYPRSDGNSITGGFVYRGTAIPELVGKYIFADYRSGRICALQPDGQGGYTNDLLIDTNFGPLHLALIRMASSISRISTTAACERSNRQVQARRTQSRHCCPTPAGPIRLL